MTYDTIKYNSTLNTSIGNYYAYELFNRFNNNESIFCTTLINNQISVAKIIEFEKVFKSVNKYMFIDANQLIFIETSSSTKVYDENFNKLKIKDLQINDQIKLLTYNVKYSLDINSSYEKKFFNTKLQNISLNDSVQETYYIKLENDYSLIVNNFLIHLNKYTNEEE